MKKIVLLIFLFGCTKPDIIVPNEVTQPVVTKDAVGEPVANVIDYDALGGIVFDNVNQFNNKTYGSLIVDRSNGYPVFDGGKSVRFEVRDGDCGWNSSFNDCENDRSRSEVYEKNQQPLVGKTITYVEHVYIPQQIRFRPKGNNLLVLTQINYSDTTNAFGALAYLVMENDNTLLIRTHRGFTWDWNKNYTITTTPYDKWLTIKYEVKISNESDGELKVYVDDKLLFSESRPTVITKSGLVFMKFGIYNSFKKNATESYATQVAYFDGLSKNIN